MVSILRSLALSLLLAAPLQAMTCGEALALLATGNYPPDIHRARLDRETSVNFYKGLSARSAPLFEPDANLSWEMARRGPELLSQVRALNEILQRFGMRSVMTTHALSVWARRLAELPELKTKQRELYGELLALSKRLEAEKTGLVFFHAKQLRERVPGAQDESYRELIDCLYHPSTAPLAAAVLKEMVQKGAHPELSARLEFELPIRLRGMAELRAELPADSLEKENISKAIDTLTEMAGDLIDAKIRNAAHFQRPAEDFDPASQAARASIADLYRNPGPLLAREEAQAFYCAYYGIDVGAAKAAASDILVYQALWGQHSLDPAVEAKALAYMTILKKSYELGRDLKLTPRAARKDQAERKKALADLKEMGITLPEAPAGPIDLLATYRANLEAIKGQSEKQDQRAQAAVRSPEEKEQERRTKVLGFLVEDDLAGMVAYLSTLQKRNDRFQITTLNLPDGRTLAQFAQTINRPQMAAWLLETFPEKKSP